MDKLFKAKSIENDKWVIGDIWHRGIELYIVTFDWNNGEPVMEKIDPNTVVQYSGKNDDNHKRIFDGDICQNLENELDPDYDKVLFIVFWDDEISAFKFRYVDEIECRLFDELPNCRIVGNKFDNLELLDQIERFKLGWEVMPSKNGVCILTKDNLGLI